VCDHEDPFLSDPFFVTNAADDEVQRVVWVVAFLNAFRPGFYKRGDQGDNFLCEAEARGSQEDVRENLRTGFVLLER
jgi:hypothetical protein